MHPRQSTSQFLRIFLLGGKRWRVGVVNLVVLACVLSTTTKKEGCQGKSSPQRKSWLRLWVNSLQLVAYLGRQLRIMVPSFNNNLCCGVWSCGILFRMSKLVYSSCTAINIHTLVIIIKAFVIIC